MRHADPLMEHYQALMADGWLPPQDAEQLTAERDRLRILVKNYGRLAAKMATVISEIQERISDDGALMASTEGETHTGETTERSHLHERHDRSEAETDPSARDGAAAGRSP